MELPEEEHILNEKKVLLRSVRAEDAAMLVDYLKTVAGETDFLMCYPDEIKYTVESEKEFLQDYVCSGNKLMMLAFVEGEYAGNCSFEAETGTRRASHRVGVGIALLDRFTGRGLGTLMLTRLLEIIRENGFSQAELNVVEGNERAVRLYEKLGFVKAGRIPDAYRYDDGTSRDLITMVRRL